MFWNDRRRGGSVEKDGVAPDLKRVCPASRNLNTVDCRVAMELRQGKAGRPPIFTGLLVQPYFLGRSNIELSATLCSSHLMGELVYHNHLRLINLLTAVIPLIGLYNSL